MVINTMKKSTKGIKRAGSIKEAIAVKKTRTEERRVASERKIRTRGGIIENTEKEHQPLIINTKNERKITKNIQISPSTTNHLRAALTAKA